MSKKFDGDNDGLRREYEKKIKEIEAMLENEKNYHNNTKEKYS